MGNKKNISKKTNYTPARRESNKEREAEKQLKKLQKNNPKNEYKIIKVRGQNKTGYNVVCTHRDPLKKEEKEKKEE